MAEKQVTHRQVQKSRALTGKLTAERRGQVLGFVLALTAIVGGITLIAYDRDAGGLATIAGALASLVAVFVYGRRKDAEEREQKRADFASPQLRLPYEDYPSPASDGAHHPPDAGPGR